MDITPRFFFQITDHTYLNHEPQGHDEKRQRQEIQKLCHEATLVQAYSVCVRPEWIQEAFMWKDYWKSSWKVATVASFPDPSSLCQSTSQRIEECLAAYEAGADEVDLVFRYRDYLAGKKEEALADLQRISQQIGPRVLKIILETCYFTELQKKALSLDCYDALAISDLKKGQRFLKTSTGFVKDCDPSGAVVEDVRIFTEKTGPLWGFKASGGIGDFRQAWTLYQQSQFPKKYWGDPDVFRIGSGRLISYFLKNYVSLDFQKQQECFQKEIHAANSVNDQYTPGGLHSY
jgi:deoxyribose-phosphate aldolase